MPETRMDVGYNNLKTNPNNKQYFNNEKEKRKWERQKKI